LKAIDRRDFLRTAAATSAAGVILPITQSFSAPVSRSEDSEAKKFLEPFNYDGVRLQDGMLKTQYDTARDYFYNIPNDDILKGFRERAGLQAPGDNLGGWYSGDPSVVSWWSKGAYNHFGQWLSGMTRMSKAAGDSALGEKAIHLMLEWARTIEPDGFFFCSRQPNAPHYIYDKTVGGLVDLCEYSGRKDALPLLEKITDWAINNLDRIRKPDMGTEWYTLSENLYRAYTLTGNSRYKTFGDVWQYTAYWKAFTSGSELARHGHHAYSHVNTMSSAAMAYAVTGDTEFLKTVANAYDWLEQTQFYATGGYGPDEVLVPPDGSLGKSLETTSSSFETVCGTWAGFKLARYLMQFTGQARYGDWIEKLAYNGIGAALPMAPKGSTFYYSDYQLGGGRKVYYPDATWPCCSGSYPQTVADYHNIIYFRDPESLYVNLFVPSEVTWNRHGDEVVVVQETRYPESDSTTLTIRPKRSTPFNLKFRVPAWSHGASVQVNGGRIEVACQPGTWATIARTWNPGDRVKIQIPMRLTLEPIDTQHPNRVAVTYGPLVLVREQEAVLTGTEAGVSDWITRKGALLEFWANGQQAQPWVPFYQVGHLASYNMYFDLKT
jgi:hypothetical protein